MSRLWIHLRTCSDIVDDSSNGELFNQVQNHEITSWSSTNGSSDRKILFGQCNGRIIRKFCKRNNGLRSTGKRRDVKLRKSRKTSLGWSFKVFVSVGGCSTVCQIDVERRGASVWVGSSDVLVPPVIEQLLVVKSFVVSFFSQVEVTPVPSELWNRIQERSVVIELLLVVMRKWFPNVNVLVVSSQSGPRVVEDIQNIFTSLVEFVKQVQLFVSTVQELGHLIDEIVENVKSILADLIFDVVGVVTLESVNSSWEVDVVGRDVCVLCVPGLTHDSEHLCGSGKVTSSVHDIVHWDNAFQSDSIKSWSQSKDTLSGGGTTDRASSVGSNSDIQPIIGSLSSARSTGRGRRTLVTISTRVKWGMVVDVVSGSSFSVSKLGEFEFSDNHSTQIDQTLDRWTSCVSGVINIVVVSGRSSSFDTSNIVKVLHTNTESS
ncbi:hypothetical protein OGAPHI_006843 [Ogataea philodendri]|uniref:Uncharacterized protein n=1 Tax=Ogataea philodendri TaxID=1378263 RepID=A0A9P8NY90_9ASCO|nr:uncharacterized protein OGAPHI_006843 [Ogataea philodendri]KAH3661436.1 hypothetical protein OGAPHI_006843 [Ogataea philodendri]